VGVADGGGVVGLAKVGQGGQHVARSAATIALVGAEPRDQRERDWVQYDFGQATAYMMLAAGPLRRRAGPAAGRRDAPAEPGRGFPAGPPCAFLLGRGCPAARPLRPRPRRARRPFDEVVHWER